MRGADVRGSIAVNTVASSGLYTGQYRVHAGGVAGSAGKNVVIDGARSQVSVSVQAGKASLVLGGIFGFCSASVDEWSNAVYEGDYGSISGITNGAGADVFVGGLAGILQNAYANGFSNTARATSVRLELLLLNEAGTSETHTRYFSARADDRHRRGGRKIECNRRLVCRLPGVERRQNRRGRIAERRADRLPLRVHTIKTRARMRLRSPRK